jgi:hypothetical protein
VLNEFGKVCGEFNSSIWNDQWLVNVEIGLLNNKGGEKHNKVKG